MVFARESSHAKRMLVPAMLSFEESVAICMKRVAASSGVVPSSSMVGWKRTTTLAAATLAGARRKPRTGRPLNLSREVV